MVKSVLSSTLIVVCLCGIEHFKIVHGDAEVKFKIGVGLCLDRTANLGNIAFAVFEFKFRERNTILVKTDLFIFCFEQGIEHGNIKFSVSKIEVTPNLRFRRCSIYF